MVAQVSWSTLYKDFTCAVLSLEYWDNIEQYILLSNTVSSLLGNIAKEFY